MDLWTYKAACVRVIDGDTLVADIDLGFHTTRREHLRLKGIDAPEIHATDPAERAKAQEAKLELALLVASHEGLLIKTYKDKREKYGRFLVDIYVTRDDGTQLLVNTDLIDRGFVKPLPS